MALPVFPNETLDAIVDCAVDNFSTHSVFGVAFTPQLVPLLKNVALVSQFLRDRAQRYLFLEIRLDPFKNHQGGYDSCAPRILDLTIFQSHPQLLEYPRSLVMMLHSEYWTGEFPQYFLSVLLPFFSGNLGKLDHLHIHLDHQGSWIRIPNQFQDAIIRSIKRNQLKSIKLPQLGLPKDFFGLLPSTLEACDIGGLTGHDPLFALKHIGPRYKRGLDQASSARPTHLTIRRLLEPPERLLSQVDTFFQRVTSLDVGVVTITMFATYMERIPNTLTRLLLRHNESISVSQAQHISLQELTFRLLPYLHELQVSVEIDESDRVVTCPSQAAMIAGDYLSPAYTSIRVFRLMIKWTSSSPADRYLKRTAGGFARLDDLLSDKSLLGSLVEVELDIRPVCSGIRRIAEEQVRLRREALEVFHKTIDRVDTFCVKTSDAFK
ncbi:hypothetical protein BKA70DRAFT_10880 [Coprinopsis sp. MPI-PUGE-AT-0042]|nr:hypothetical protein BKA70DRAFT_10880 [Coprinopsis sp. MPI-PUGE-AT-0042]